MSFLSYIGVSIGLFISSIFGFITHSQTSPLTVATTTVTTTTTIAPAVPAASPTAPVVNSNTSAKVVVPASNTTVEAPASASGSINASLKTSITAALDAQHALLTSGNAAQIRQFFLSKYADDNGLLSLLTSADDSGILEQAGTEVKLIPTDAQLNDSTTVWTQTSATEVQITVHHPVNQYSVTSSQTLNVKLINGEWYEF